MKLFIKKFFLIALEILLVNKSFRHLNRGKIKVLLYHNLADSRQHFANAINKKSFRRQLEYLKNNYNIVRISQEGEWIGLSDDKVNILMTFDDGFINNYEVVLPILVEFGIHACFFLISDCIEEGNVPHFAQKSYSDSNRSPEFRTVNRAQVKEMFEKGMTIGSHSSSHEDFSKLDLEKAWKEASQSKQEIESLLATKVECFAFPWGFYKEEQLARIKKLFRRVFIVEHGFNLKDDHVFHRNEVDGYYHMFGAASGSLDWFKNILR